MSAAVSSSDGLESVEWEAADRAEARLCGLGGDEEMLVVAAVRKEDDVGDGE